MDPQGRILLEQCGLTLASAENEKLLSSTELAVGVYIGVMHMEYIQFMSGNASGILNIHRPKANLLFKLGLAA